MRGHRWMNVKFLKLDKIKGKTKKSTLSEHFRNPIENRRKRQN
jgi:hypothetical protein